MCNFNNLSIHLNAANNVVLVQALLQDFHDMMQSIGNLSDTASAQYGKIAEAAIALSTAASDTMTNMKDAKVTAQRMLERFVAQNAMFNVGFQDQTQNCTRGPSWTTTFTITAA